MLDILAITIPTFSIIGLGCLARISGLIGREPLLGIGTFVLYFALLFACAPMISVYPLFGQRFGLGDITAATLIVSTLASFVTISLVLWLIRHGGLFVTP
ncbi:hypothetical protein [Halomonas stenophila]|uniref:Putative permease n=1 Tax=Halomonas stenophila TaxID=795312 RepID=A0A7W5EWX4_9GAMM|nr:hypothetical protein [Halomonas stenophila]MBB3231815.1 putative permease [Halomonas stenophila]